MVMTAMRLGGKQLAIAVLMMTQSCTVMMAVLRAMAAIEQIVQSLRDSSGAHALLVLVCR